MPDGWRVFSEPLTFSVKPSHLTQYLLEVPSIDTAKANSRGSKDAVVMIKI